jgi:hypothetical protein
MESNNRRMIADRVAILLAHYYIADMDAALRARLGLDWVNDLAEFPASVVASVCDEWRRSETKRPVIADMRARCLVLQPPPPAAKPALLSSDAEMQKFLAERAESWRKAEEWRNSPEGKAAMAPRAPSTFKSVQFSTTVERAVELCAMLDREKPHA